MATGNIGKLLGPRSMFGVGLLVRFFSFALMLAGMLLASSANAQTRLSLGPSVGTMGETVDVPILLGTDRRLAGIQIELSFDSTAAAIGTPVALSGESRFRVAGSEISAGAYRLLILGEQGDLLPSGRLLTIPVTLSSDALQSVLAMSEIMIADEYGLERNYLMAPYLELMPPNGGMAVDPLTPMPLSALADFGNSGVTSVQLFANGQLIGSVANGGPAVDWTPEEPGKATLKAVGILPDGSEVESGTVDVDVNGETLDDYEAWKAFYFSEADAADPSKSDSTQDPDGDGRDNLREYAEGTKPMVKDAPPVSPAPFFIEDAGKKYFAVRMRRRIQVPDLEVKAIASSDLQETASSPVTDLEEAGNFEVVTFHTATALSESSRGFLQIEVSRVPTP